MSAPIPVPSLVIDETPQSIWGVYWRMYPDGTQEMPATVPRAVWMRHCRENEMDPETEPPRFWRGYWGQFAPHFGGARLSEDFWERYLAMNPKGHGELRVGDYNSTYERPARGAWDDSKHGYFMINGSLRYKHPNGVTYAATGVDTFPPV